MLYVMCCENGGDKPCSTVWDQVQFQSKSKSSWLKDPTHPTQHQVMNVSQKKKISRMMNWLFFFHQTFWIVSLGMPGFRMGNKLDHEIEGIEGLRDGYLLPTTSQEK